MWYALRMKKAPVSPQDIQDAARAFMGSRILLTAFELGVFTALSGRGRTAEEAARLLRTDPRGLDRLLRALCARGWVRLRGGRFVNSQAAEKHLVRGRPGCLAGLGHTEHLYHSWGTLTAAVRAGGTVQKRPVKGRGKGWLEPFIAAMHGRGLAQADAVARLADLRGCASLLDVGGGSGVFAMALVRRNPGLRAVVFDLPEVVPLTRRYVREAGLAARVRAEAGDYEKDPLGTGYDAVLLSAIIHSLSPSENLRLLRKAARALRSGGRVVIQDNIMDEARLKPASGALFALNMLVNTAGGDTYTEGEVRSWLRRAGFGPAARRDTRFETSLLIARKR